MNTDIEMAADEEYQLPCAEAVLAGTLALMTAHAQACCDSHRQQIAAKIASNLTRLTEHPVLSAQFRMALWNLRTHWNQLRQAGPPERDPRLWHATPEAMQ